MAKSIKLEEENTELRSIEKYLRLKFKEKWLKLSGDSRR